MGTDDHAGGAGFDHGPWRRKQLMVAIGGTVLSLGFVVWLVARWGEVCVNESCWGNGAGSASSVAWAGLAIGLIGLCLLVMGALMKAPRQVTLVPEGEVSLSKTRVMLRDGWDEGGRPTVLVGGHAVECAEGGRAPGGRRRVHRAVHRPGASLGDAASGGATARGHSGCHTSQLTALSSHAHTVVRPTR